MQKDHEAAVENFMNGLIKRNPNESEFHQAVREVVETFAATPPETLFRPTRLKKRFK